MCRHQFLVGRLLRRGRTIVSIATAIQGRNLLSFMYDGYRRMVEPHTCGMDTKGHMALRA